MASDAIIGEAEEAYGCITPGDGFRPVHEE